MTFMWNSLVLQPSMSTIILSSGGMKQASDTLSMAAGALAAKPIFHSSFEKDDNRWQDLAFSLFPRSKT